MALSQVAVLASQSALASKVEFQSPCHSTGLLAELAETTNMSIIRLQTVPLTSLPMELQLRIVRFCLVTDAAFIDFNIEQQGSNSVYKRTKDEHRGQDKVALGILRTNRLYRAEGFRILWQANNFLYNVHRSAPTKGLRSELRLGPHIAVLCHLTLRQTGVVTDESIVVGRVLPLIGLVVHRLPSLETLQSDFVHASEVDFGRSNRGAKDHWMFRSTMIQARERFRNLRAEIVAAHTPESMVQHLQQVVLTGLFDNQMGWLAVILFSALVKRSGTIGVGMGHGGQRYADPGSRVEPLEVYPYSTPTTASDEELLVLENPEIEHLTPVDVEHGARIRQKAYKVEHQFWEWADFRLFNEEGSEGSVLF